MKVLCVDCGAHVFNAVSSMRKRCDKCRVVALRSYRQVYGRQYYERKKAGGKA